MRPVAMRLSLLAAETGTRMEPSPTRRWFAFLASPAPTGSRSWRRPRRPGRVPVRVPDIAHSRPVRVPGVARADRVAFLTDSHPVSVTHVAMTARSTRRRNLPPFRADSCGRQPGSRPTVADTQHPGPSHQPSDVRSRHLAGIWQGNPTDRGPATSRRAGAPKSVDTWRESGRATRRTAAHSTATSSGRTARSLGRRPTRRCGAMSWTRSGGSAST